MAIMIAIVFSIVNQGFKTDLLRASDDDLRAIEEAYTTANPHSRAVHEAREMIEDRTVASDAEEAFLLQVGNRKVAGNLPTMRPQSGVLYLPYTHHAAAGEPGHQIMGRGAILAPGVYAFVGRDLYEVRQSEHRILITFAGILAVSIVLAGLSGLWLSGRYLRRVDAISSTCRAIMAGRLGDRIVTRAADGELERLAATINSMLDRIQVLMESLRQVSNDIAHDLRTPLAHLRYSLEKALDEAGSEKEFEAAARQAIAEADQLLEMFAALLRIARIESGSRREAFQQLDLGELIVQAFAMYKPVFEDADRPASTDTTPEITVWGDRQLLLQLIANLLDNAVNHTPSGTCVTGWAGMLEGRPSLVIADTGHGVPEAERNRILRRFFRLEQSRTSPGHGLGLSMVAAIVDLHDARILLSNNNPGLRITIQFPPSAVDAGQRAVAANTPVEA